MANLGKVVLWVLVVGAGFALEAVTLMWVTSTVHDWWPLVPAMGFESAFGVTIALSCAISVWKLAEAIISAVNEL